MMTFLIWMAIVASVLLVLVVLAQNAKGGGLSSQFGGSTASNMIGVKKTGDVLERVTWGLAIAIMVFSLATNLYNGTATDPILDKAKGAARNPTSTSPIQPLQTTTPQPAADSTNP
jgi:preprotein translocase subunit SecG